MWCRALRGFEDADAFAEGGAESVADIRGAAIARRIVVAALCDEHGHPLLSYGQTGIMTSNELEGLSLAVQGGLDTISPTYWRHNIDAWHTALKKGAAHSTNVGETIQIGICGDMGGAREDIYFGLPIADLTDGQRMAFTAARVAYTEFKAA